MAVRKVIQAGNPILREKSKIVSDIGSEKVQKIIQDLIDSMGKDQSVGMAVPQIGKGLRIFVSEIRKTKYRNPSSTSKLNIYINPKIIELSKDEAVGYEGCTSVAIGQFFGPVKRPSGVVVEAFDRKGKKFSLEAKGLLARVIQHEYDHLEGILFTDKIDDWKKIMSYEEYIKMRSTARPSEQKSS